MRSTLGLSGIRLRVRLGVTAAEREMERTVLVSVQLLSGGDGDLPPPPDYDAVIEAIASHQGSGFELLEDLAGSIMSSLHRLDIDGRWRVRVDKHSPPTALPVDTASIELED